MSVKCFLLNIRLQKKSSGKWNLVKIIIGKQILKHFNCLPTQNYVNKLNSFKKWIDIVIYPVFSYTLIEGEALFTSNNYLHLQPYSNKSESITNIMKTPTKLGLKQRV